MSSSRHRFEGGITLFDIYGGQLLRRGESEKILGQSLKNLNIRAEGCRDSRPRSYSRGRPGAGMISGASRGHIMDGVEASLRRFAGPTISTCTRIHGNDPRGPLSKRRFALIDTLVQQGKGPLLHRAASQTWQAMEDRQSPRHLRNQEPGAIRYASGFSLITRSPARRLSSSGKSFPLLETIRKRLACSYGCPLARVACFSGKFSRTNQKGPADSRPC